MRFGVLGKGLIAVASVAAVAGTLWPYEIIGAGYSFVQNARMYDSIQERTENLKWYQDNGGTAVIFEYGNGHRQMIHDGYPSLYFDERNAGVIREQLTGAALPTMIPAGQRDNALIVGFGTGITVGAAAEIFDTVKVYEVRESILTMAKEEFSQYNYNATEKPNVEVVLQDGIVGLAQEKTKYSGIYINIPSPGIRGTEKIYSAEVFQVIKEKLKEDGKVFFWLHATQGFDVLQVLLNTIRSELSPCRYFYLSGNYYQVVCSPGSDEDGFYGYEIKDIGVESANGTDLGMLTRLSEMTISEVIDPEYPDVKHTLDHPWFDTRALFTYPFDIYMDSTLITTPKSKDDYCDFINLTEQNYGQSCY